MPCIFGVCDVYQVKNIFHRAKEAILYKYYCTVFISTTVVITLPPSQPFSTSFITMVGSCLPLPCMWGFLPGMPRFASHGSSLHLEACCHWKLHQKISWGGLRQAPNLHTVLSKIYLPTKVLSIPSILWFSKRNVHTIRNKDYFTHIISNGIERTPCWAVLGEWPALILNKMMLFIVILIWRDLRIQTPFFFKIGNRFPCTIWCTTWASAVDNNSFKNSWCVFIIKRSVCFHTCFTLASGKWRQFKNKSGMSWHMELIKGESKYCWIAWELLLW